MSHQSGCRFLPFAADKVFYQPTLMFMVGLHFLRQPNNQVSVSEDGYGADYRNESCAHRGKGTDPCYLKFNRHY